MRRIIHVCGDYNGIYVLCDDGSMWGMIKATWQKFPDIPQDQPHENKITFEKVNPERKD